MLTRKSNPSGLSGDFVQPSVVQSREAGSLAECFAEKAGSDRLKRYLSVMAMSLLFDRLAGMPKTPAAKVRTVENFIVGRVTQHGTRRAGM